MAQYLGDRWGVDRGFPGGSVSAITQTPDGYLWIATEKGLVRFDGLSFRLLDPQPRPAVVSPAVLGLAVADDGALLLRMRGPLLLRFDGRDFTPLVAGTGRSDTVISAMTATPDGTVLIAPLGDGVGVTSYAQGTFTRQVPSGTMASSFVMSIARAADKSLWLGTRDAGLVRYQNGALTRFVDELADPKVNSLLATPDGAVLIGTDQGVSRWSDGRLEADGLPGAGPPFPALGLLRDRDANIWIAAGPAGLIRANAGGVLRLDAGQLAAGDVLGDQRHQAELHRTIGERG
jgi:ligand-binding sensor domain-containing protein